ncbi:MAG: cation:proton antiporter [Dehalococcoidia bacterium]|nr:cation:proton antiporter [Dehalococcoidia bacterium]
MHGDSLASQTSLVLIQLALVLIAAKFGAEIAVRWAKQPAVIGELVAGIAIGPFALGGIPLPFSGLALFPIDAASGPIPVSAALYVFTQVGAAVLLFTAGLETDLNQFARYGARAALVAAGGVVGPFVLVAGAAVIFGLAPEISSPGALFLGAVVTATSVGITARVLTDLRALRTPEGTTIIGAAVVDDVLGILVLAIVISVAGTASVSVVDLSLAAGKALLAWVLMVGVTALLGDVLSKFLLRLRSEGAYLGLGLALALLVGLLAEQVGLAFIIGAYSVGLGLSRTPVAEHLIEALKPVAHALVPPFFVVMGMLVDLSAILPVLGVGIALSVLAAIGKIAGCGLPALAAGYGRAGALRIGFGMLPRGEVALIVAGTGLSSGLIDRQLFGVAVLITLLTTLPAPWLLERSFGGKQAASGGPAPAPLAS